MFSKALYKQSWKANGIMWLIITIATCFMLACVMLISGGGNITEIRNGISDTIIDSTIESSVKDTTLNYYELSLAGLDGFDKAYLQIKSDPSNTNSDLENYQSALSVVMNNFSEGYTDEQKAEIQNMLALVINFGGGANDFYTDAPPVSETGAIAYTATFADEGRDKAIQLHVKTNLSIVIAKNMVEESNVNKMVDSLKVYDVTLEKYDEFGYVGEDGYNNVKSIAVESIITYQAQIDEYSNGKTAEEVAQLKKDTHAKMISSFISTLPTMVSSALEELGQMDLYSLIVGSIFFKMAGLLLPIIYMIMTANALVAGQVDSGSMAYILSTSTKRKQVTFTQATFLISSLLLMFTCTYLTSVVCLSILDIEVKLTYTHLLFMNLGAFLAMFAMSGICFLASCWFNRSKYSMALGGGLNMFFLVATMLGLFGSPVLPSVIRLKALNFFNYTSLISLFDVISILDGTWTFVWKFAILLVFGITCYIIGSRKFERKDLPL